MKKRKLISWVFAGLAVLLIGILYSCFTFDYVTTSSMEPTVPKGSLCLIKKTDFDGVKSGDVILFKNGDTIVLHRLIEKDADYGITKGDANNAADGISVTRSQNNVMGKLVFAIPLVGAFFYSIYGKVLICVVIFLILYFGIFHDKDDEEDDTEESCENQTI